MKRLHDTGGKNALRRFRFVDNTDESWREFGRTDPYFGVLSDDRFRAKNLDAKAIDEFFRTGESHIEDIFRTIKTALNPNPPMGAALDFGCGVGRLILPLAAHFESVMGVDISEAYIAEAARNCSTRNVHNVAFAQDLDALARENQKFDFVHSTIVFNHIPWKKGKKLIAQLFDLLDQGGIMAVQVLHRRHAKTMRRLASWARRNFLPVHWLINVARKRPIGEPLMQGHAYPLDELLPFLKQLGASDFHIHVDFSREGEAFAFIFCSNETERL